MYYNEYDPAACEWLRELMKKGSIPEGDIDERSIADVGPDDLKRYTQCHFFAGIGGWAYALRLAQAQDLECWTGSCPCQPFSAAGKKRGTKDERHLWPEFFRLIAERRPPIILGEQVEDAVAHGWLDLVSSGLEAEGYACGSIYGTHSVGAPHHRQRLYWGGVLGDANDGGQVRPLRGKPGKAHALAHAHRVQHGQDAGGARGQVAGARGVRNAGAGVPLPVAAQLAGWPTPNVGDSDPRSLGTWEIPAKGQVHAQQLSPWPTPITTDAIWGAEHVSGDRMDSLIRCAVGSGTGAPRSTAATEKPGQLNPELSRWLMGFPAGWSCLKGTATRSSHRSRRRSSRR